MLKPKDFCIFKREYNSEIYLYVSDKASLSTAICIKPDNTLFTLPTLLECTQLTAEDIDKIIAHKDNFDLNKMYDLETFLS